MKQNPLITKTDTGETQKNKFERIGISLPAQTYKDLEMFVREARDRTGYKLAKSEVMLELIKLLPALDIDPAGLTDAQAVRDTFDIIRRKIEQR